jgi:hypothetical protein
VINRAISALRLAAAPEHAQPAAWRLIAATVVALAGSLVADAVLVRVGTAVFPGTSGYDHFQFSDYATLTVIGVLIACAAWPVVTRLCRSPRWLFARLAVLVTVVLLLPDVLILTGGQPARAVAVLMVMHLAIAVVTYLALTRIAPERTAPVERRQATTRSSRTYVG